MNPFFALLRRNRIAQASFVILVLMTLVAILAPWIAPSHYADQNLMERLQAPSLKHLFGTDALGRDLFSRVIYGSQLSLAVGFASALSALFFGTLTGLFAGYFGGWFDRFLMRVVDFFYIFPSLLLAILLGMFFGRGVTGILVALSITAWVNQTRIVRGLALQARSALFMESARALGASKASLIFRHLLPNILGPTLVSMTFQVPNNIMAESFLSFVGLGLQPPYSSWGTLANEGFRAMRSYPHLMVFPGVALFITLMAFNFLGEALRDASDPRDAL